MDNVKSPAILSFGNTCVAANTHIDYIVVSSKGKHQNRKGGTIENLYYRFNNIKRKGLGYYKRKASIDSTYSIRSFTDQGLVIVNTIQDVLFMGDKEVWEITTSSGKQIKATLDHKFFIGEGQYTALKDLLVGSTIMTIDELYSIPKGLHVHHKDGNCKNNMLGNLELLTPQEQCSSKLSKVVVVSRKYIGVEPVYDIQCNAPYHNYVANGIGVHNCTGKSFSLATLFKLQELRPNQRVVILTTERNSIAGIEQGITHYKIDLKPNQLIVVEVKPTSKKAFGAKLNALKQFANESVSQTYSTDKGSNANKDKYTYLIRVITKLTKLTGIDYVTNEAIDIGNIADLEEEDILVIDGLSPIVQGIWQLCLGDRIIGAIGDYNTVQKQLMDITSELVNSIECGLIMLAHEELDAKGTMYPALNAGQAIFSRYLGNYTDVVYNYRTPSGKYVWSGKKMKVATAPRSYPMEDQLAPDFSLYNFFRDDGKI